MLLRPTESNALFVTWWDDQVYSMTDAATGEQWFWNASAGMRLAEVRGEMVAISLQELGVTVEMLRQQYPELDEAYALTTNIARPLLFVPYKGNLQLIDGWHRMFHALVDGRDLLPAYILTSQEMTQILIYYLQPVADSSFTC